MTKFDIFVQLLSLILINYFKNMDCSWILYAPFNKL